ncbi:lipocalin family protein [Flammeovirga sp. SJP92]|uniref:lipocalin family protein n=1 Tax=Flammeovirga sp. SJP92 TaxID=1775430 RepID=UPI0012F71B70|nr:lipocalin family protein [Flammeovirga sp. SJP92]
MDNLMNISKLLATTFLAFISFNGIAADVDDGATYINKRAYGTVAFSFQPNGKVQYVLDYSDGSFYEFEGTYTTSEGKINVSLEEGHGENSAGIKMDHLAPNRPDIKLIKEGDLLIDMAYGGKVIFHSIASNTEK